MHRGALPVTDAGEGTDDDNAPQSRGAATCDSRGSGELQSAATGPGVAARYERLTARAGATGGLLAAASRKARHALGHPASDASAGEHETLRGLGAAVAGQGFAAFLLWLREHARNRGIRQIAFLARDGELPYRMAQAMPPGYFCEHLLVYLHVSRKACMLAGMAVVGVEAWRRIGEAGPFSFLRYGRHEVPLAKLLERLDLVPAELPTGHALRQLDPAAPLPPASDRAWLRLLDEAAVRRLVLAKAEARLALAAGYLETCGLEPGPTALVDVGWLGQLGSMVSALVGRAVAAPPLTLHMGGFGRKSDPSIGYRVERFAFDDQRAPVLIDAVAACVELFTAADRPRVVAYARDGASGAVAPVFEAMPAGPGAAPARLWEGAEAVAAALPPPASWQRALAQDGAPPAAAVAGVFRLFWESPEAAEVRALQRLQHENDYISDLAAPLVRPYRLAELLGEPLHSRTWRAGSLLLTTQPLRTLFWLVHQGRLGKSALKWHVKALLGRLGRETAA